MKGGCVTDSRLCVGVPRLCVGVPLLVRMVVLLNGGRRWVHVVPLSRIVPVLFTMFPVLVLFVPLVLSSLCFCLVVSCLLWVGKCGGVCEGGHSVGGVRLTVWCVLEGGMMWGCVVCGRRAGYVSFFLFSCLLVFPVLFLYRTLCVCRHSIVGLGLCFCDRVVSLWNSGGGLCWVEGRGWCVVVSTHHRLWCASQWCV